jgi:hypothetical protein
LGLRRSGIARIYDTSRAITRRPPGEPSLSPCQAISIRDVIVAYAISGARFSVLNQTS